MAALVGQTGKIHLRKNVVQTIAFLLKQDSDNAPKTGDASNITVKISKDGATASTSSASVSELNVQRHPGVYLLVLTADETNADIIRFIPATSTGSMTFFPQTLECYTDPNWADVKGASFSNTTDTLEKIRDFFDTNLKSIVESGLVTTELSGVGWLSDISSAARRYADEPSLSAKFDPANMLTMIVNASRETFVDYLVLGESQVIVRYDVTLVTDQQDYLLPPNVGLIHSVAKYDSSSDSPLWEVDPSTHHDPFSFGFTLEGNLFRLKRKMTFGSEDTVTIYYTPSGDINPHLGKILWASTSDISEDGTTILLPATATDGKIDQRAAAYGGSLFRILSSTVAKDGVEQAIPIKSSTIDTSLSVPLVTIVLRRPLTPIPDEAQTVTYEIVPLYYKLFQEVVAIQVARAMITGIGNKKRFDLLTQRYREVARAMRLQVSKAQLRQASRFDGRTMDNKELGYSWGQL